MSPATQLPALARDVVAQLQRIEKDGGSGAVALGRGRSLDVTSLDKPYFPEAGLTKGDLLRYYARVAPVLLPAIADRPLALRRHPEGVDGFSFYQQDPGEHVPDLARVEEVDTGKGREDRLVGGDPARNPGQALGTLLYTVQIGSIAVNPWHSRLKSLQRPDYATLDLDPGEGVPFRRLVEVAGWIRAELRRLKRTGIAKTSGSRGIHVLIPLGSRATWEASARLASEIASRVAEEHPAVATVERSLRARPKGTIYVDHLQNAYGKTLASVLSARAKPDARVSMPLAWARLGATLGAKLDPGAFTIRTVPRRLAGAQRVWAGLARASQRRAR